MKKRIFSRSLYISIVSFAILCGIVFSWIYIADLVNERNSLIEKEKNEMRNMSNVISVQTYDYFERISMFLKTANLWLKSHPEADPRTDKDFIELVDTFRSSSNRKIDIRLVSEDGGLFYIPSKSLTPLADVKDRSYFKAQANSKTREFFIADPVLSRVTNIWGIPISYPLESKNAGISVVFAAVEIPNLEKLYAPFRANTDETITLVRDDGMVLAHTPFENDLLGKPLKDWSYWENAIGKSESGVVVYQSPVKGNIKYIAAYQRVENFPLAIVVMSNMDNVLAPWNKSLPRNILIIIAAVMFILLIVILMQRLINNLEKAMKEITHLSVTDSLTHLFNRRYIYDLLEKEVYRSNRYGDNLSIIILDIDFFKVVNDTYGHNVGDEILKAISQILVDNVRKTDVVSRWGGEEFVILCNNIDSHQAVCLAEKIRQILNEAVFEVCGNISCSFGVSTFQKEESIESLINRADEALYISKHSGRNKVTVKEIT